MLEPIRGRRRLQPGRKQAREDIAPTRRVARTMARITPSSNDRRRIVAIAMARYAGPREVEAMVRAGRLDARPGDSESRGSQAARLLLLGAVTRASDSRMAPAVRHQQSESRASGGCVSCEAGANRPLSLDSAAAVVARRLAAIVVSLRSPVMSSPSRVCASAPIPLARLAGLYAHMPLR